ncbi:uncharacterized protein LOC127000986 [Eriocheir sinensis]|uniref:uncharacterized protein LOC127000986 n=1 Tax=Eriocheir sinensis TaxID=95602 RepID=UPI0021C9FB5B|nr:uncharacterized protein LOC127000986 [Eriocheir sinensis]
MEWQGGEPIHFLHTNLDQLMQQHSCSHILIVGDLNQHLVARVFDDLLTVHGLTNHVTFPTHNSGSSLDPVISDLPEDIVTCRPLGAVGSSDHLAVLSTIQVATLRDAPMMRTNWLWGKADWEGLQEALCCTPWHTILTGDVDEQVSTFTSTVLSLQNTYVPNHTFKVKPRDQPWFGYECRMAADAKSRAWRRFKEHPTYINKLLHKEECANMRSVQRLAQQRWQDDLKSRLSGRSVGSKAWWTALKDQQGLAPEDQIPPLDRADGSVATRSNDKAEVLAAYFSGKMTVPDPERHPPAMAQLNTASLQFITITTEDVKQQLLKVDTKKALGPDGISPHILNHCAAQLAGPITTIF